MTMTEEEPAKYAERHVSAYPDSRAVTSFRSTWPAQIGGAQVCPSSKASECHRFCTEGLEFDSQVSLSDDTETWTRSAL